MEHIALRGGAFWSGLAALAVAVLLTVPREASAGPEGVARKDSAPAQPQRAKQIEPMVEPVKRVAPKTPELGGAEKTEEKTDPKKSAAKSADKTRKVKLVGAKPNCDAGYEPDKAGRSCIKAATAKTRKKNRKGS